MALRYIDSLGDHYTVAQANWKWTSAASAQRVTGLHGYGMRGLFSKGMLFGSSTLIQEVHLKRIAVGSIFSISDTTHGVQILVGYNSDGSITVRRLGSDPAADLIVQTAPDLIRPDTWYHFGWKVLLHASAGTVDVRLNGASIVALTGIRTIATSGLLAGTTIGSFSLGDNTTGTIFDDLVVMDDVDDGLDDPRLPGGGGFDKFLGPVVITIKRPTGAGALTEWTPSTGSNYQNVDDPTPDSDTTVNSADPDAVGDSDLFTMGTIGIDEDVVAVQSLVLARTTDAGVAAIAPLVRDGGTTTVGPTAYQPSTYSYLITPEPTRPDGSGWTAAAWDAIQYGYRRIV